MKISFKGKEITIKPVESLSSLSIQVAAGVYKVEKFAKIFDTENRQILVKKGQNSDGENCLCIITHHDGVELSMNLQMRDEAIDKHLVKFDSEMAAAFDRKFDELISQMEDDGVMGDEDE